ncbi:hypothetical protein LG634_11385 [Streptomyces bambusae]|uniref:hypothetical protein n=1 Tax=Streptomyces bambusae TaxID=1550616 RepID=UPI001CFF4FC2|nr:hypothetical protein [Streptomyces bambusae]MCB5165431.1 hypothetical protein [Streptomyces bambusae]
MACALAALLALAGCSEGTASRAAGATPSGRTSGPPGTASPSTASPSATPAPTVTVPPVDEAKVPKNRTDARALLGRIIADSRLMGPGVRPNTPYESDPARYPVLDADCIWQTGPLPADVLATRTRYFHIPARQGRGRVELSATVTVHRSREESAWEVARAMEEIMRCPEQQLRNDERLTRLIGTTLLYGEGTNAWTEDAFNEYGEHYGPGNRGPFPYTWGQGQYGPVTVAVSAKASAGLTSQELAPLMVQGTSWMMQRAKDQLGKAG